MPRRSRPPAAQPAAANPAAPDAVVTTDHAEIRYWAETRGAQPSRVAEGVGGIGLYRPGEAGGDTAEPMPWQDWFRTFDAERLAFEYGAGNRGRLVRRVTGSGGEASASPPRG